LPTPKENEQELTWAFHFVRTMTPHPPAQPAGDTTSSRESETTGEREATSAR